MTPPIRTQPQCNWMFWIAVASLTFNLHVLLWTFHNTHEDYVTNLLATRSTSNPLFTPPCRNEIARKEKFSINHSRDDDDIKTSYQNQDKYNQSLQSHDLNHSPSTFVSERIRANHVVLEYVHDKKPKEVEKAGPSNTFGVDPIERSLPSKNLFLVGPWIVSDLIQKNLESSPELQIHVFNHTSMTRAVRELDPVFEEATGISGVWESYRVLRPWAFRADLFRYLILWSEGGIYLDTKMKIEAPIDLWASLSEDETLSVCHDGHISSWISNKLGGGGSIVPAFSNGALSAKRGSPILVEAISQIVETVSQRSYYIPGERTGIFGTSHQDLSVSGPILLGYAYARYFHRQSNSSNIIMHVEDYFRQDSTIRIPCDFLGSDWGYFTKKQEISMISSQQGKLRDPS